MCYLKDDFENKVLDSVARLDSLESTPDTCDYYCHPGNCEIWTPYNPLTSLGPPPYGKYSVGSEGKYIEEGCDITITKEDVGNLMNIRLQCKETGDVMIHVFDLLGNSVLTERRDKNTTEKNIPIQLNLSPGIYFCVVRLNENAFHHEKFIILN